MAHRAGLYSRMPDGVGGVAVPHAKVGALGAVSVPSWGVSGGIAADKPGVVEA